MMKVKCISWMRRVFVGVTVFCLAASFGTQPAQASPLADQETWGLEITLDSSLPKSVCPDKELPIKAHYEIISKLKTSRAGEVELAPLIPQDIKIKVLIHAELGEVKREGLNEGKMVSYYDSGPFRVGKTNSIGFSYQAPGKEGDDKITIAAEAIRIPTKGKDKGQEASLYVYDKKVLTIKVKGKCAWNIRGNTDMGALLDARAQYLFGWDFTGSYDIIGTIETQEDGTLSGEGTVSYFLNAPQGAVDDVSCQHVTPWQGQTTVAIKADPDAWEEDGVLKLQLHLAPMQVNSTSTDCVAPGGGGSMEIPGYTITAFDLNLDPLPVEGGALSLKFQFPDGSGDNPMDLIITPEEAES